MKRTIVMLGLSVFAALAASAGAAEVPAQDIGVQRAINLQTDLAGIPGKDGVVYTVRAAPGAGVPEHIHPGDELGYVLEGSMVLEIAGKPPATFKAGESFHVPPRVVHSARNASATAPLKVLVFGVFEKGQPDTLAVQ